MIGKKREKEACGCQTKPKEQRGWLGCLTLKGSRNWNLQSKLSSRVKTVQGQRVELLVPVRHCHNELTQQRECGILRALRVSCVHPCQPSLLTDELVWITCLLYDSVANTVMPELIPDSNFSWLVLLSEHINPFTVLMTRRLLFLLLFQWIFFQGAPPHNWKSFSLEIFSHLPLVEQSNYCISKREAHTAVWLHHFHIMVKNAAQQSSELSATKVIGTQGSAPSPGGGSHSCVLLMRK